MRRRLGALGALALLGGCASVPDVTYRYYPVTWSSTVTVTQTIGCNADQTMLIVLNAPSVATSYARDLSKKPFEIRIKDLGGLSSDVEMAVTFTEDGRLKTVNQSTTGQGEALAKSIVALEGALPGALSTASLMTKAPGEAPQELRQCADIERWGDKKPITLMYRASVNADSLDTERGLKPAPESEPLFLLLKDAGLPKLSVKTEKLLDIESSATYSAESSGDVLLELQKTGVVPIEVRSDGAEKIIGRARLVVPRSETYRLPIPKAALFGKQTFSIALSEAGAVTSLGYGKTVGAPGALNALTSIVTTQTVAADAAEIKAQADLIAQQQRLVLCLTKPDQCK